MKDPHPVTCCKFRAAPKLVEFVPAEIEERTRQSISHSDTSKLSPLYRPRLYLTLHSYNTNNSNSLLLHADPGETNYNFHSRRIDSDGRRLEF